MPFAIASSLSQLEILRVFFTALELVRFLYSVMLNSIITMN